MTPDDGMAKTTPRPKGLLGDKDLGGNIPPADMEPIHTPVADLSGTGAKYQEDQTQSSRLRYQYLTKNKAIILSKDEAQESDEEVLAAGDDMDEDPQDDKELRTPSPKQDQPEPSHVQESASDSSSPDLKKFDNILPLTERQLIRDQTEKLMEASMSSLDRSSTTISDLYKGLNVITQLLKEISNAVKDDPATNQKINEATKTFTRISSNVTEVLFLVKGFDFSALLSTVKSIQDHADVWSHPSSAPSGSVTPTLALTDIQVNVEGENANTTATEEPPSHTKGETEEPRLAILISSIPSTVIPPTQAQPITSIIIHPKSSQATPKIDKGKGIATESDDDPSKKLVKASSIVRPDPDEPVRVEFIINGRTVYLTEQEIQDYWDKEEQIKKAEEEARLLAIKKLQGTTGVKKNKSRKPRKKPGVKAGELFKKDQDAEHDVLKKQHIEKVRKSLELRKHKYDSYMWTISNRLKPEPITDIKIHPKTKPMVITVYRGTDGRNFDVHKPFLFGAFGISELDELREIIPKKKNTVVKDLMNSLSQRYERLRQIPRELGIQSALLAPEQAL
ncbi:hypothetical protein Tco_1053676 [Tanacetum coccineum]|uniref:Uncharacterized protein n=1 Tax=Tanacetum coccineum TaxID=301880 RepID=A0ABQ5GVL5_9ASTR